MAFDGSKAKDPRNMAQNFKNLRHTANNELNELINGSSLVLLLINLILLHNIIHS